MTALARWQRTITDDDGNVILDATIEVRRETAGYPKAVLYADREGLTPKSNVFTLEPADNGLAWFHATGGAYKVRAYAPGGFDVTWRYEAIGTAAEQDSNQFGQGGWIYEFEADTAAPPSAGCVRFNHANPLLATKAFVHYNTLGGVSQASMLAALDPGAKSTKNTVRFTDLTNGSDISALVSSVVDHGTYKELILTGNSGLSSIAPAATLALSREISGNDATGTNIVVTATGATAVPAGTTGIVVNLSGPGSVELQLPAAAAQNGLPITTTDWAGNATITFTPNGSEKVMGLSSAGMKSSAQGFGAAATTRLTPITSPAGWF